MKALLAALAVVIVAACYSTAYAVDWTLLGQSDNNDTTLYYAQKSVKVQGDYLRVQSKRVYSRDRGQELADDLGFPLAVAFSVETQTVDCAKHRRAFHKITYYGQQGKILDRIINQGYAWQPFTASGLNNALCDRLLTGRTP